ncbi:MAG: Asp-tRNA(Asn)/Glu-tRNA(Gln) amidotransferase subunit GatA [Myxococcales bacterium]|nr:Asp-tRNA(Asn)/Glu-tRNA(Gln) amidotransferase subunit GatA [Myxococcales bacterium]
MTLIECASAIAAGSLSALDATNAALARIESADVHLNAMVHVDAAGARAQATAVDEAVAAGQPIGPLAGVPITIKDLIAVGGQPLTAGSNMLAGYVAPRDASVIARLRAAGAVLLGKTSLDEFAMGSTNETAATGPVRNPWGLDRVPGGSSGGSAAAVAAGYGYGSLGTDTGGSVRLPAAFCGVVGLKPTYGRVSRSGVVAYASSLDQVGPMAATVRDTARLFSVIAGPCAADATSRSEPIGDYEAACELPVAGLRVGLVHSWLAGLSPEVHRAVMTTYDALLAAGATGAAIELPHAHLAVPAYYLIAMSEASANLARYDGVRYGHRAELHSSDTLDTLYARSRAEGFGPEVQRRIVMGTWALSSGYYDAYYDRACRVRRLVHDDLQTALSACDVILGPTAPSAAWPLGAHTHDPIAAYQMDIYTTAANLAGLPAMSVPVGLGDEGLPLAVQLIAGSFKETTLFQVGAAVEQRQERLSGPAALQAAIAGGQ